MPGEQKNKKKLAGGNILGFGSHLRFAKVEPIKIYRKIQIIIYDLHQNIIFLWKKNISQSLKVS